MNCSNNENSNKEVNGTRNIAVATTVTAFFLVIMLLLLGVKLICNFKEFLFWRLSSVFKFGNIECYVS